MRSKWFVAHKVYKLKCAINQTLIFTTVKHFIRKFEIDKKIYGLNIKMEAHSKIV